MPANDSYSSTQLPLHDVPLLTRALLIVCVWLLAAHGASITLNRHVCFVAHDGVWSKCKICSVEWLLMSAQIINNSRSYRIGGAFFCTEYFENPSRTSEAPPAVVSNYSYFFGRPTVYTEVYGAIN